MTNIIMHIGMSKNGSSALQTELSKNPIQKLVTKNTNYMKYVAIGHQGNVYEGRSLSNMAICSPSHYVNSTDIEASTNWSNDIFNEIRNQFSLLSNNNENILVMSNEGWFQKADTFKDSNFFEKLDLNAKVICYIRNPVDWINSAWWQWAAWTDYSLENALDSVIPALSNLHIELIKWQEIVGIDNITIKVLPQNIISDFSEFIGIIDDQNKKNRSNTSLPAEILRFYQMHKELRPDMDSSSLDFILSDVFNFDNSYEKTPWVLNRNDMRKILKETKEGNEKLIQLLDLESKKKVISDPKWWSVDAFFDKNISSPHCEKPCLPYEKLDKLLLDSIMGIKDLYLENMYLKRKLLKNNLI